MTDMVTESTKHAHRLVKEFSERQREVLLLLATEGHVNKHRAMNLIKPKPAYSTVHCAFQKLTDLGMVSKVQEGTSRTGLAVHEYYLNVLGLALTIAAWSDEIEWAKMAEAQKGALPRVFGKWNHFDREGGEELAKKSLLSSIRIFLQEYDWDATYTERQVASRVSRFFLLTPVGALTRVELARWYTILAKDRHLATWAKKYIEEFVFHYREEIKVWTRMSEMLKVKRRANS
jgi:hypothetical protein